MSRSPDARTNWPTVQASARLDCLYHNAGGSVLGMKKLALALWYGDVPLRRVFWEYAVSYGTLLNLVTTLLSLMVLQAEGLEVMALAIFLLPLPYNLLMTVAVWRSASRYEGPERWAQLARVAVIAWAVLASLA